MFQPSKLVPPVYFLTTILVMAGLHWFFPIRKILEPPLNYLGVPLMVLGLACTIAAAALFKRAGTPVRPFEQSTVVVTDGLYRITRNPMYLGLTLSLFGVALLFGTVSTFIPIPFFIWIIQRQFIEREEAFMENIFGNEYLVYKARVRRWL